MNKPQLFVAALSLTAGLSATSTEAGIIVQDDFSGTGNALNGTSADVFTAIGTGQWVANANFFDNGTFASQAGEFTSAYISLGEYINNTKGNADGKFELTATIQRTGGRWFSVGFSSRNTPSANYHFLNYNNNTGTIIQRSSNALDVFTYGNANGADFTGYSGARTVTIALDLTDWDGISNFGSATYSDSVGGVLTTYEYTSDTDFESLFFTGPASASATFDDLTLTQIPEPGSLALLGLGGLMIARRRRQF